MKNFFERNDQPIPHLPPHSAHSHSASLLASLQRRILAARAADNAPLIEQLELERLQILDAATLAPVSWLARLKQQLSRLWAAPAPQIYEYRNGTDHWWYTIDPQTGRAIYADSAAELQAILQPPPAIDGSDLEARYPRLPWHS